MTTIYCGDFEYSDTLLGHIGLSVDSLGEIYANLSDPVTRVRGLREAVRCAA